MKIAFNGYHQAVTSGCKVCGSKRKSKTQFLRRKKYYLPSGMQKEFLIGMEYELSQDDATFLLDQTYTLHGVQTQVFREVIE